MDEKKNTEELLAAVYRNVTVGSENLGNMVPKIKDKFLMRNVTGQMEQYSAYAEEASAMLKHRGVKPDKMSAMEKAMCRTGAALNTMFDSSDRHIANMIVVRTKMGADELETTLCHAEEMGAEGDAIALARCVVEFERLEENKMKDFT